MPANTSDAASVSENTVATPRLRVCVFCASTPGNSPEFMRLATELGTALARRQWSLVYGGGRAGLMGAVADAAMTGGSRVLGILPQFMDKHEIAHRGITDLRLVDSMEARLSMMLAESDCFVALPGGPGTLEELFFIISRVKLNRHTGKIILINHRGYFDPTVAMLDRCLDTGFLAPQYRALWTVVPDIESAMRVLAEEPLANPAAATKHLPPPL
ncbi:MAG: TIGR00730 family Rossman fold protein [Planctomycetes bacterium]|nr:TIGR00730 family Rossman fold protein [Planctomycetota bacterium]